MVEHIYPKFTWMGMVFDTHNILMMVVTCLIVFLLIFFSTRRMTSGTPRGMQNFIEWVIEFVRGIGRQMMDDETAERFVTLGLTLFLYIFVANQLGLIGNFITHGGSNLSGEGVTWWFSPTATVSVPFALAIMVLVYSHYIGMKRNGRSYWKGWVSPHWALLPLNLIEEGTKLLSFPLRLYGNIFAGEVLIWVLVPAIMHGGARVVLGLPLIAWIGYSIFVGAIQAFIFTMLTMVYISHRVSSHDAH